MEEGTVASSDQNSSSGKVNIPTDKQYPKLSKAHLESGHSDNRCHSQLLAVVKPSVAR